MRAGTPCSIDETEIATEHLIMRASRHVISVAIAFGPLANCRADLNPCADASCGPGIGGAGATSAGAESETGDAGASGAVHEIAPGGAPNGGDSAAGAGGEPEPAGCATAALQCPPASSCNDAESAPRCVYPRDLPFVAYVGNDLDGSANVIAVPLQDGEALRLDWSSEAEADGFNLPWQPEWSPDGQALVFYMTPDDFFSDFSRRYYWVDMTASAPLSPQRLLDIPVNADLAFTAWSPTSKRLLVFQDAGAYVVDFANGAAATSRVGAAGKAVVDPVFCSDGSIAYQQEGSTIIEAAQAGEPATQLELAFVSVSPGRRWLLLSDGESDYVAACAPGATARSLGKKGALFDWSGDESYFASGDGFSEPVTWSLWQLQANGQPKALTPLLGSSWGLSFQPAGRKLLYQAWQDDAPATFRAVDPADTSKERELPIPIDLVTPDQSLELWWIGQSSRVLWSYFNADREYEQYLIDAASDDSEPQSLTGLQPQWFSSDGKQLLSIDSADDGQQLWLIEADDPARRRALFEQRLPCKLELEDGPLGSPPLLNCSGRDDAFTLYALAADLRSAKPLSAGAYADDPAARPLP